VLLTLSAKAQEQGRRAAEIAAQLLQGKSSPAEIPPLSPREIEFIVNLREARAMGLKIPLEVITSASKVIR
jgi:putative ABC transport system substrate-binding protein